MLLKLLLKEATGQHFFVVIKNLQVYEVVKNRII